MISDTPPISQGVPARGPSANRWTAPPTTEPPSHPKLVADLLHSVQVDFAGTDRFTAATDQQADERRRVVEGSQVLAQAIVAVAHRFPAKSIRSSHAVFARVVLAGAPIDLDVDVVSEGRTTATAVVMVSQNGKRCVTVTVMADVPGDDVIRHQPAWPDVVGPHEAHPSGMHGFGNDVRFVDVRDVNSPDEVGPPHLFAWFRCGTTPSDDAQAKALVAIFTGWFGIATSMRPHAGVGASQAHITLSTAPLSLSVAFHEPFRWTDWLVYSHDSQHAGAGMSYVRGTVHTFEGALIASFAQEALIRPLRTEDAVIGVQSRM